MKLSRDTPLWDLWSHLPPHKCELILSHNPHTVNYETVEDYLEFRKVRLEDWVSPAEYEAAIRDQEFWELLWYPDTPVGFCLRYASTLEAVIRGE